MAGLSAVARVLPFESVRNAEFIANQVPGVRMPEALLDRMRRTPGRGIGGGRGDCDADAALAALDGLR